VGRGTEDSAPIGGAGIIAVGLAPEPDEDLSDLRGIGVTLDEHAGGTPRTGRTNVTDEWQARAEALADKLIADGDLRTAEWRAAVCGVPRHELVPRYYEPEGATYRLVTPDDDASRRVWLDRVYSDTTLITAIVADSSGRQVPVTSSTKPDLMVRMLEALDVRDGHRRGTRARRVGHDGRSRLAPVRPDGNAHHPTNMAGRSRQPAHVGSAP
jgi:hypothetical protein